MRERVFYIRFEVLVPPEHLSPVIQWLIDKADSPHQHVLVENRTCKLDVVLRSDDVADQFEATFGHLFSDPPLAD